MGQFGRFESTDDLPSEAALVRMVKEAKALADAGARAPRTKTELPLKAPASMLAVIRKNRKAHAAYEAFSPSHKREYIEWITGAKTDETRARRLATAVEWIAEGSLDARQEEMKTELCMRLSLRRSRSDWCPPVRRRSPPTRSATAFAAGEQHETQPRQSSEMMPEASYDYRPVDGVRNGGILRTPA